MECSGALKERSMEKKETVEVGSESDGSDD